MIEDKLVLAGMKQGWNDRGRYDGIIRELNKIKEGLKMTPLFTFAPEEINITLGDYDLQINYWENIYGELFVTEYKEKRKELSLLIGEDKK
jgi:hypothetical protein